VSPSDYIPAVGDVVEFDDNSFMCKGIIFKYGSRLAIVAKWQYDDRYEYDDSSYYKSAITTARKIGEVELYGESDSDAMKAIAKAYFSKPTFTGSYEERQKQWLEHHGLKVGSKVKVVREFEGYSDGFDLPYSCAVEDIGLTLTIMYLETQKGDKACLKLSSGWCHPYTALEPA
jgi:hypothetical protein